MTGPDEIFDDDNSEFTGGIVEPTEFDDEMYDDSFEDDEQEVQREPVMDFEIIDDSITDIDFSDIRGDFKSSLKRLDTKIKKKKPSFKKQPLKAKRRKPLNKHIGIHKGAKIFGKPGRKTTERVLVPRDRKVIVEGVDKFMLSTNAMDDTYKNIGYYKGKKLKAMVLTFNNNSANDFNIELFNPSAPLDYLYSTSQNLNNMIEVAGGVVAYSDILFNILSNPTFIPNARIVISGPSVAAQQAIALGFKNKNMVGEQKCVPLQISQNIDIMQVQSTVVNFDIIGSINRPFIPDGMDVINYTILAGNTVTLAFYFKQIQLKRLFFPEAKASKELM